MCRYIFLLTVLILGGVVTVVHAADTQFWNTYEVEAPLKGPWSIRLEEELRILLEDDDSLEYTHTEIGLIYQHTDWLATNVNYLYALRKNKSDHWEREHRPSINALITPQWRDDFDLEYRSRVELITRKENRDVYRFRNRLNVTYITDWTRFKISPFATEEFFIDTDQPRFKFNRFGGGFNFQFTEHLGSQLYYMRQDTGGRGEQQKAEIFGFRFKFKF